MKNKQVATTNNTKPSEQMQMINALVEMFSGKNLRYFIKENNEIWFVCKDVVEAVGGKWHIQNFQKVVGEGAYTICPLEINGISQNIMIAPHKTIIKWLTLSRLPKAEPLSDLVWKILDKVFKGEEINKTSAQIPSESDKKLIKSWNETIQMVNENRKWGCRFINFLSACDIDRDRYTRLLNNFFDSFHGDYDFKKDIIHKMRKNFQSYKKDALVNCKSKDISMMNTILLEVEREIENLWARYEAHSRGQLVRHNNIKKTKKKPEIVWLNVSNEPTSNLDDDTIF